MPLPVDKFSQQSLHEGPLGQLDLIRKLFFGSLACDTMQRHPPATPNDETKLISVYG